MSDKVTATIIDSVNYTPSEVAYTDDEGSLVGYWAYGFYDPYLPYQGDGSTYECGGRTYQDPLV